ncbi:hypothetical protein CF328_g4825 [Tilletia controversa]|nr:hypothetical protein CF328_g4825 [Tilletia controversa]
MSGLRLCNTLSSAMLRPAVMPIAASSTSSRSISHTCMRAARASSPSTSTLRAQARLPSSTLLQHRLASSYSSNNARGQAGASGSTASSQSSASAVASDQLNASLDKDFRLRRSHGLIIPGQPTTGRSVTVVGGDLGKAYRIVMGILRKDDIRGELRRGERYEKPNQERRRKRSERHRRRFADLVRKKVQLVMALRARDV